METPGDPQGLILFIATEETIDGSHRRTFKFVQYLHHPRRISSQVLLIPCGV